ncbi:MAG: phosphatidylserine decarboxylase [Desulfobulbaceae bacterium BRH_c16a]|nr:MAG: phosphatidylserine decarboxylase [Desulfobulbaceae bacterium BRH_c16a]
MIQSTLPHQYIDRNTRQIVTEKPIGDHSVRFLYNGVRESAPAMFKALTSARISRLLAFFHYDLPVSHRKTGLELFKGIGADWHECLDPLSFYDSHRKVFERRIRYWETRPMNRNPSTIVSPADSRILIGSLADGSALFIKDKFFDLEELLGPAGSLWHNRFRTGDFAVFRLTPDKYHYNHVPVSGRVVDIYNLDGRYHSCNPSALIAMASLCSKNRRVVTIINTDVDGGSAIGMVAMVEIVALMIGDIVQTYSEDRYTNPQDVRPGMFLTKGCPKSLFRPGSSTDVLLFEPNRIRFADDLVSNSHRNDVQSRFTNGFGRPLAETDIMVRSAIAEPLNQPQLSIEEGNL